MRTRDTNPGGLHAAGATPRHGVVGAPIDEDDLTILSTPSLPMSSPPANDPSSRGPDGSGGVIRNWQLLVDELNRLNAQLEYLKLMLKLDQRRREQN